MGKFMDWIEKNGGVAITAELLDMSPRTIYAWQRKECTPAIKIMRKIVKLSKFKISFEDIINDTKKETK